jgi:hypothetical protein
MLLVLSRQKKYPSASLGEKHWETYPSMRTFEQTSIVNTRKHVSSRLSYGGVARRWLKVLGHALDDTMRTVRPYAIVLILIYKEVWIYGHSLGTRRHAMNVLVCGPGSRKASPSTPRNNSDPVRPQLGH